MRFLERCVAGLAVFIVVLGTLGVPSVLGAEAAIRDDSPHLQTDQILEISTRGYPCHMRSARNLDRLRVREIGLDGSPTSHPLEIGAGDSFTRTWIFVHGNQISAGEAIRRGLLVYRKLRRQNTSGPVRFIIWSWPSRRDAGRIRDARQKVMRTDVESLLLGNYLAQTSGEVISLVGYSFGARIITGAVHLAAGGALAGSRLQALADPSTRIRVSLLAAAVERDALLPGGRYGHALDRMEALLLMNNSRDVVLRFFWVTDPWRKPIALGDTGLVCVPRTIQVQQFDWARSIGREHSFMDYVCRPAIMSRVAQHVSP